MKIKVFHSKRTFVKFVVTHDNALPDGIYTCLCEEKELNELLQFIEADLDRGLLSLDQFVELKQLIEKEMEEDE